MNKFIFKERIPNLIKIMIFGLIAICMIFKCRYGFSNIDESFYITIPYRILQGDNLFKDEWNISLMSAYITYPFVKLWMLFTNSTEGICLYMRYAFVFVNTLTAAFVWKRLKRYSEWGAWLASIAFLIYAPFCVGALSYNSGGLICMVIALIIYMQKQNIVDMFIGGYIFGLAVLCCPYSVILFLYLVIMDVINKRGFKYIVAFVLGGGFLLIGVIYSILSNMPLEKFIEIASIMVSGDEEHGVSIISKIITYPQTILTGNIFNIYFIAIYVVAFILMLVLKEGVRNKLLTLLFYIITVNLILSLFIEHYINKLMFPIAMTGIIFYFYNNVRYRDLLEYVYIPGLIFSLTMHIQSNQFYYAITSGSVIMVLASMVFIYEAFSEFTSADRSIISHRIGQVGFYTLVSVFLVGEMFLRIYNVFWEDSIKTQCYRLMAGPEKGLIVSEEKNSLYNEYYEDVTNNLNSDDEVLFLSDKTYLYLMGGYKNMSYSAWLSGEPANWINKLSAYYEFNPEKIPSVIFIDKEYSELQDIISEYGYENVVITEQGNIIYRK
ncbi:hypothetical protein SAMN05421493_102123 [Pseudobutyrivibrio sp. 49]|uniref:hypothetical protein n=1 Tax=Pseudobutyrivibrio sp. 49 TaxID=1855344 RepID=UPI0008845E60|nr:hypothetical protein [Pseudobutyrivibrio sp. 49]SDH61410.1 hypothetical protein SAMN05421493_102123 [Pseudobutyrivibrio sp. 49]